MALLIVLEARSRGICPLIPKKAPLASSCRAKPNYSKILLNLGTYICICESTVSYLSDRSRIYEQHEKLVSPNLCLLSEFLTDAIGTEKLQNIRETALHNDVTANADLLRSFASVQEMYSLNITVNSGRVTPLEKCVWNRVEKEMAARFKLCDV